MRTKQIESQYDFTEVQNVIERNLEPHDGRTFRKITNALMCMYRDMINVRQGLDKTILITGSYASDAFEYTGDDIMIPAFENAHQMIHGANLIGRLLVISDFYGTMLEIAHNPTDFLTAGCARFIFYFISLLLDSDDFEDSDFSRHLSRIFFLLDISIESVLMSSIEREVNMEIHGDLTVFNTQNEFDVLSCVYGRILRAYNTKKHKLAIGEKVTKMFIFESHAGAHKFLEETQNDGRV